MFVVTSMSDFSASAGMLSGPAALPLLICLVAILISSVVGGLTSIGRSVCAASMSGGFIGAGLFRSFLNYSTHPFRCYRISVIGLPSLSLTGFSGLLYFPSSFLVVSYSCFIFPSLAAFSAVVASSSTYFFLSALMLSFTCLFASMYSACAWTFSTRVRLFLIAVFLFFLSLILFSVSIKIHSL
ncbi:unnamed protein product [Schistosoma margrebowiei]|uniref:Uncharacterized protein n=1 Tax=Schistosoma margrebowiei TaxID=48269 RepID=A0A183L9W4_9TREM|nr:unnamed protein product [Schistosoma margrebowiei]